MFAWISLSRWLSQNCFCPCKKPFGFFLCCLFAPETSKAVGHGSVQQWKGGSVIKGTERPAWADFSKIINVIVFQSSVPVIPALQCCNGRGPSWGKALENHGLVEWFGLGGTLKLISFHPLLWGGTPSSTPGCSELQAGKEWNTSCWNLFLYPCWCSLLSFQWRLELSV